MAATQEASEDLEAVTRRLSEVTGAPGQERPWLLPLQPCSVFIHRYQPTARLISALTTLTLETVVHPSRAILILILSPPPTHIYELLKAWEFILIIY